MDYSELTSLVPQHHSISSILCITAYGVDVVGELRVGAITVSSRYYSIRTMYYLWLPAGRS
jgi:hypothetical protein